MHNNEKPLDNQVVKTSAMFFLVTGLVTCFLIHIYRPLIVPLGIGALLSFLLSPIVDKITSRFFSKRLVVSILIITLLAAVCIASIIILPHLYAEVSLLISIAPKVVESATTQWIPSLQEYLVS